MASLWERLRRSGGKVTPEQAELTDWMSRSRILADQVGAAVRISGADRSSYQPPVQLRNGAKDGVLGIANWNGQIEYDEATVVRPLRDLERNGGRPATPEQLKQWRNALHVMLHENAHLLTAHGRPHEQARRAFQRDAAVRALEEGVTELWSEAHLNRYIEELGVERYAPQLVADKVTVFYPNYVGATAAVVQGIGHDRGLDSGEVLDRLNREDAGRKWEVLAELAVSGGGIDAERIPAKEYGKLVTRVERRMKSELRRLESVRGSGERALVASAAAGRKAVAAGRKEIQAAQQKYGIIPPERTAGRPNEQQAAGPRQAGGDLPADLRQAAAAARTGSQPLDRAQAGHPGHSTSAPAVGARPTGRDRRDGPASAR